jgi:septum formation protein
MSGPLAQDATALWLEPLPLIVASKSEIRARLLQDAGVPVEIRPSDVDERAVEASLTDDGANAASVAGALAAAKAIDVSTRTPGRLVVGADQTLSLDGERFTKPRTPAEAHDQLGRLAGRMHVLSSGAALARDGVVLWSGVDEARLAMRPLSDRFLDAYLGAVGASVMTSVGGYHFEGLGAQLFDRVDGDFRTVLGLPLLPLLSALRRLGALAE